MSYDTHCNISDINFLAPSGSSTVALAIDHFTFDGDLRPATTVATWQSGSGSTETILNIDRGYDAVGNVIGQATWYTSLSGASNTGGSEVQNFCYDEQNRLVWAGNSGTQPAAGNGTCGDVPISNTFGGNAYNTSFAYTYLGQLWQGPTSTVFI